MQLKHLLYVAAIASPVLGGSFKLLRRAEDPTKEPANRAGALGNTAGAIDKIISLVNGGAASWNYEEHPNMCELYFYARNVGKCDAQVTCADKVTKFYPMPYCNLDGPNYNYDDRIGGFHIQFMEKSDDTPGTPIVWFDNVNDGDQMDVEDIAEKDGKVCDAETGFKNIDDSVVKLEYCENRPKRCGVPLIGKNFGDLDSQGDVNDRGYADGWCGLHVTQHQKPDPSTDNYTFDVTIKDANEDVIGEMSDIDLPTDETKSIPSKLEWTLDIKAGAVDDDAVWMYYGDQAWTSNDPGHHCDFGAYDNGKREGDCGFSC